MALESTDKPLSGNVELFANIGLGRSYYWREYCHSGEDQPAEWDLAKLHYEAVLTEYAAAPEDHLHLPAVIAYTILADIASDQAWFLGTIDADEALISQVQNEGIEHRRNALKLGLTHDIPGYPSVDLVSNLLDALCFAGQTEEAVSAFDSFLNEVGDSPDIRADIESKTWGQCYQND
ncbi:hypothetical protein KFU94_43085 [Chloroflexi bacterium TSY]|nr:hypothetical protein [Chloroflexi bacterium TSY]